jgi:predicted MFS family arabinose efflux permease
VPWGMLSAYLADYLAQDQKLGVSAASTLFVAFGIGSFNGTLLGGMVGDALMRFSLASYVGILAGTCVLAGAPCVVALVLVPLAEWTSVSRWSLAFAGGLLATAANPNVKAVLMNATPAADRELALALHVTLDDVGKALGPLVVAPLVLVYGRKMAFTLACAAWVPCALLLYGLTGTYARDVQRAMRAAYTAERHVRNVTSEHRRREHEMARLLPV